MKTMSFIPKLRAALGVIFILTIAGAISVTAQTQPLADNSSSAANNEPKKAEAVKPAASTSESTAPEKTAEVSRTATSSSSATTAPVPPTPAPAATDAWQYQLTPYAWIPGWSGTMAIGNRTADVSSSITDTSVHINFAFMGTFEAHRNKLTILTDLVYANIGTDNATPGPGFSAVESKTKAFVFDPEVGYRFGENKAKGRFVEVLGGIRYWHVTEELNFTAGILPAQFVSGSRAWVDGIVGLRGKAALSPKWFVTGKMDVGGGGSKLTYQFFGGVGVMVSKKVALIGGFRDLYVDKSENNYTFKMSLHGPVFGLGFKF